MQFRLICLSIIPQLILYFYGWLAAWVGPWKDVQYIYNVLFLISILTNLCLDYFQLPTVSEKYSVKLRELKYKNYSEYLSITD